MNAELLTTDSSDREIIIRQASRLFTYVRDVHYMLGLNGDPKKLFIEHAGNCTRKHLFLLPRLQSLGYRVTLGIAEFNWRDMPIPSNILSLLKDPIDTHLFLYVSRGNDEIVLDASWDKGMPNEFVVNEWDGSNSTPLGVPAINIRKENYTLFRAHAVAGTSIGFIRDSLNRNRPTPFNDAFNNWLGR